MCCVMRRVALPPIIGARLSISIFAQLVIGEILFKTTSLDNSIPREIFLITK